MEVTIERILPGGFGLAHAEGKTLMVALAAPGDRLRVRVDRVKGNVGFASIVEVVEPAAVRIAPPCPYFGRCGGCDFQQLTYEAQLSAKAEIIKDCLHRIGRIENIPEFQVVPSPNQWRYRSRAQWQYDLIRQRLGYFESASRRVCDVSECAVLAPELQQTFETLRHRMSEGLLPDDAKYFRAVAGDEGVSVAPSGNDPERLPKINRAIGEENYNLNAESFFQTNIDLLPQLIEAAIGESSGDTAIELYSGVGLFTLPLSRRFNRVIAVEENPEAARFARENLAGADLVTTEIVNAGVGQWLDGEVAAAGSEKRRPAAPLPIEFRLLEPPRAGAETRHI